MARATVHFLYSWKTINDRLTGRFFYACNSGACDSNESRMWPLAGIRFG